MSTKSLAVVTGGAGFIGSHAVDQLAAMGYRVHVIDDLSGGRLENLRQHATNPDVLVDERDVRTLEPTSSVFTGADLVIHFAGIGDIVPSIERPTDYMDVNIQGTVRVMECAREARVGKLVYAASSSCYGLAATPTDEDAPIDLQYPYALSKYLGEQAALHWCRVYGLPVASVRIFNAYGPRVRTTGAYGAVFGVFLKQRLAGQPMTVVGDGTQSRDFLYVTDVADAFIAAGLRAPAGRIYNLGAGNPQSVNRLVELIGGETVHIPKRPGEPDCTWADITRITSELDWRPKVSFEDGVKAMIDDIDAWQDAPLWDPASIERATASWFAHLGGDGQ